MVKSKQTPIQLLINQLLNRRGHLLVSICFLIFSQEIRGESDFKGVAFANFYRPRTSLIPQNWGQDITQVWLTSSTDISETASSDFTLALSSYGKMISGERKDAFLTLREGYFEKKFTSLRIKAGRMFLPWGNGDGFNPTDVLGAWDQGLLAHDDEMRRIASDSLVFDYLPHETTVRCVDWVKVKTRKGKRKKCREKEISEERKNWKFTVLWTPSPPQGKWGTGSAFLGPTIIPSTSAEPTYRLEDSEYALKWDYEGEGWDFALMGFYGYQHMPHFVPISATLFGPTPMISVRPEYLRQRVYGFEFSTNWAEWILTSEFAHKATANPNGEDRTLSPTHNEGILGLETGFASRFRAKAQIYFRDYKGLHYDETTISPITEAMVQLNSGLFGFRQKFQNGYSGFINYENEENGWKAEIFAQKNNTTRELLGQFQVSKRWADSYELTVGLSQIEAPEGTPAYDLRGLSSYFAEVKAWF